MKQINVVVVDVENNMWHSRNMNNLGDLPLTETQINNQKAHAPLWILVVLAVLIVTNIYAVIGLLSANGASYAILRIIYAALWIVLFTALIVGLMRQRVVAQRLLAPLLTVYGIVNVIGATIAAKSDYSRGQLVFQMFTTAVAVIPIWWAVLHHRWLARPITNDPTINQPEQNPG
jgi:hypothetical protein